MRQTRPTDYPTWLRASVAAICAYEAIAITSRKVPTITTIQTRQPVIGVCLVTWLAVHFYRADQASK